MPKYKLSKKGGKIVDLHVCKQYIIKRLKILACVSEFILFFLPLCSELVYFGICKSVVKMA